MDCTVLLERKEEWWTFRSGMEGLGAPSAGSTSSLSGYNINTCKSSLLRKRSQVFSDFETQCHYHQTEPTAYMFGNSIAARYLPGGELITMLGFSFRHYR